MIRLTDIEIAKRILNEEDLTLALVKNGQVIFKSRDKGIKPIYILAKELKSDANGASLADRVIGRGAAILCGYMGIKEVYTDLISTEGEEILEVYKISFSSWRQCSYIKNRDKTDYCPIEKLSLNIDDPLILMERIEEFIRNIGK